MHEYFLACPNGGFYDYRKEEICARRPLGVACLCTQCDSRSGLHKAWRVARQASLWGPGALPRKLRHIAYISETQLAKMNPYLPEGARLHHILNPIEVDLGTPRVVAEANDAFLFIGRLMPEKGALDFAHAAKAAGVRAVFLGAGPQEHEIRAVNPEAELVGWVNPNEVSQWIGQARVLVFPSVWPEPFGLVAAEALSRGVPAVVGRWNAACEMIEDGVNGRIYDHRQALAGALATMSDVETVAAMSREAYSRRMQYAATPQAYCARVIEVLEEVIKG